MKKRYGMVIDLRRCIGCDACTMACRQAKASSKGVLFARVFKYERGTYPYSKLSFLPVLCMHCADPPCQKICPTGATEKREDGPVVVDAGKCVGCKGCIIACPYGARDISKVRLNYFEEQRTPYEIEKEKDHVPGTAEKCDLCEGRVNEGREPACVMACPGDARIFGDLSDKRSKVARLIVEREGFQLNPELGTDPSVYYLHDD